MSSISKVIGFGIGPLVASAFFFIRERRFRSTRYSSAECLRGDQKFRASLYYYYFPCATFIAGYGVAIQGILRWIHLQKPAWPLIILGGITALWGSGLFKGLFYSCVTITDETLEYKDGIRTVLLHFREVGRVELNVSLYQAYILLHRAHGAPVKIPLIFQKGPELYATLKSRINGKSHKGADRCQG